jgi:hypothetical protein
MTTSAPARANYALGRLGVALAVVATLLAGGLVPGGALLVGLSFAYIVWGDDPRMKFRFAMLAGVTTMFWALALLPMTGLFTHETTMVNLPQEVHAPPGWTATH